MSNKNNPVEFVEKGATTFTGKIKKVAVITLIGFNVALAGGVAGAMLTYHYEQNQNKMIMSAAHSLVPTTTSK
jgi:uncharacterized membrane protein